MNSEAYSAATSSLSMSPPSDWLKNAIFRHYRGVIPEHNASRSRLQSGRTMINPDVFRPPVQTRW